MVSSCESNKFVCTHHIDAFGWLVDWFVRSILIGAGGLHYFLFVFVLVDAAAAATAAAVRSKSSAVFRSSPSFSSLPYSC